MDLNTEANKSQVSVFEEAAPAAAPYAPRPSRAIGVRAFTRLLVVGALIFLLEYLDTTVRPTSDVVAETGAKLLSVVGRVPRLRRGRGQLFVLQRPASSSAEAIRLLRTNLQFAATARPLNSLVVSSPGRADGKSVLTANLAVAIAQTGQSAVVIDADLRRPSQHRIFEVKNDIGLTTLLTDPGRSWHEVAVEVVTPNLRLIPSGPLPSHPTDLLSSDRLRRLIAEISEVSDVVLLDTSPIGLGSDPLVVAAIADGVVLVCRVGRTRLAALRGAIAAFRHGAIAVVGIVLNRQAGRVLDSYYRRTASYRSAPLAIAGRGPVAAPPGTTANGHAKNGRRSSRRRRPTARSRGREDADDSG
jgi:capsular exopolysaccharide synthesis family protein